MGRETRAGAHIKVAEVMGWGCRCIRRRLIIICTKYFVIVNYGAATAFRRRDQASDREGGRKAGNGGRAELFCIRLSQSGAEIRALDRARDGASSSARSGPLRPSKPLSATLVFRADGYHGVFLISRHCCANTRAHVSLATLATCLDQSSATRSQKFFLACFTTRQFVHGRFDRS